MTDHYTSVHITTHSIHCGYNNYRPNNAKMKMANSNSTTWLCLQLYNKLFHLSLIYLFSYIQKFKNEGHCMCFACPAGHTIVNVSKTH